MQRIATALTLFNCAAAVASAQTFDAPREVTERLPGVRSIFPLDVDSDGDVDVLACSPDFPGVRLYWNDGGGRFGPPEVVGPELVRARGVAGGDLDGDGDVDLIVSAGEIATASPRGAWYLEGAAPGEFSVPVLLAATRNAGTQVDIADLDGDGDLDAAVGGRGLFSVPEVLIENLGGGSLVARPSAYGAARLLPLDVDDDGRLDLLQSDGPSWRRSTAPFVYGAPQPITGASFGRLLALGDLDGDGDQEIVGSQDQQSRLAVFPNLDMGGFGPPVGAALPNRIGEEVVLLDADLDGDLDIVHAAGFGARPAWFESDGALGFTDRGAIAGQDSGICQDLRAADLDGDGLDDLVLALDGHSIAWIRADAAASTTSKFEGTLREITRGTRGAERVVALDFDADGIEDVVAISDEAGVFAAQGLGDGEFGPFVPALAGLGGIRDVVAGELTGDGIDDIVVRTADARVLLVPGGAGGFSAPLLLEASVPEPPFPLLRPDLLSLADVDGDGDLDVLAMADHDVLLRENQGAGSFAPTVALSTGSLRPIGASAGDLDGDGTQDLVVATTGPFAGVVLWYRGFGGGAFGAPITLIPERRDDGAATLLDVDGDGRDEVLVVIDQDDEFVSVGLSPSGSVEQPFVLRSGDEFRNVRDIVAIGDANADGVLDALITRRRSSAPGGTDLVWLPTLNDSIFLPEIVALSLDLEIAATVGDVDADGDLDALVAAPREGAVFLVEALSFSKVGVEYCSGAEANSTGEPGRLRAGGSTSLAADRLTLRARDLPSGETTLFLASLTQGFAPNPAGSDGDLCLGGTIGRFIGPGQIGPAGPDGVRTLELDLAAIPAGQSAVAVMPMDRWLFQAWYRDGATSNFTTGLAVVFE